MYVKYILLTKFSNTTTLRKILMLAYPYIVPLQVINSMPYLFKVLMAKPRMKSSVAGFHRQKVSIYVFLLSNYSSCLFRVELLTIFFFFWSIFSFNDPLSSPCLCFLWLSQDSNEIKFLVFTEVDSENESAISFL